MWNKTCSNTEHRSLLETDSLLFYTALIPQAWKRAEKPLLRRGLRSSFSALGDFWKPARKDLSDCYSPQVKIIPPSLPPFFLSGYRFLLESLPHRRLTDARRSSSRSPTQSFSLRLRTIFYFLFPHCWMLQYLEKPQRRNKQNAPPSRSA